MRSGLIVIYDLSTPVRRNTARSFRSEQLQHGKQRLRRGGVGEHVYDMARLVERNALSILISANAMLNETLFLSSTLTAALDNLAFAWVVPQKLLNQINMRKHHAPAAVPIQTDLVHCIAVLRSALFV